MVASLARRGRPTYARVTVTSLQIAMDTHTPPRHYSLLHKRTLTESGSRLKACGGRGGEGWGLFKAKSVPARGWASSLATSSSCRLALVSWVWAAAAEGVGKDSWQAGRHECHVLRDRKSVMVAAATMSCVYCVDIWRREGPLPNSRGLGAWVWPALAHGEACSELTSCGGVMGGGTSGWL